MGVSFDLSGKVALITGASRGIGLAIAEAYAVAGAKVALASRKQDAIDEAAEIVRRAGGDALAVAAHTGDGAAVSALVETVVAHFGGIDIVVNNAGNVRFSPFDQMAFEDFDSLIKVHL